MFCNSDIYLLPKPRNHRIVYPAPPGYLPIRPRYRLEVVPGTGAVPHYFYISPRINLLRFRGTAFSRGWYRALAFPCYREIKNLPEHFPGNPLHFKEVLLLGMGSVVLEHFSRSVAGCKLYFSRIDLICHAR